MAEETGTSGGCESATISVSNTHDECTTHRTKDIADDHVTSKRRRSDVSEDDDDDLENTFKVSKRKTDMNCHNNINNAVSTAVTSTSHHVISSFLCTVNHDNNSIPDLKAKCIPETRIFISKNKSFSDVSKTSTMICLESEEMAAATNEAISCRNKPSPVGVAKMPSAEELEEFFAKAEKYEQKRFAEKYNFDIVKDVPIEGRYQWIKLKP